MPKKAPAAAVEKNPATFEALKQKIEMRQAKIGIIGLGYVGLPLACAFGKAGYATTGFDLDERKISSLRQGRSYIPDVPEAVTAELSKKKLLSATSDFAGLADQDAIVVCVPTPLRKTKDPDVSYIVSATQQIKKTIRVGQLVILESTTYPGTTREILLPALSAPNFQAGRDFFLGFSPERVDPGNEKFGIHNTPKVVGGLTPKCLELASALYGKIVERVFPVSSVEAAEMAKLLENTFRAVNIGLVNEMALICEKLGVSIWEVIEAAKTKPFGFMPFYPGPGIGGHCIPLDPHYLAWKVKSFNLEPRFIELADAINSRMPDFVVEKAADLLNQAGKALSQSKILAIGVAYKKNTTDCRESPALVILEKLLHKKAKVTYHDPFCPTAQMPEGSLSSIELTPDVVRAADLCLILTDHSNVDYGQILKNARLVLDTRNVYKGARETNLSYL